MSTLTDKVKPEDLLKDIESAYLAWERICMNSPNVIREACLIDDFDPNRCIARDGTTAYHMAMKLVHRYVYLLYPSNTISLDKE